MSAQIPTESLSLVALQVLERLEWAVAPRGVLSPEVARLRMQMRAAGYHPDRPYGVEALATVVTVDTARLRAVLTGRAPMDYRIPRERLARTLGVEAVGR